MAAFIAEHPFASAVEIAEVRAAERAKEAVKRVPYYDLTINVGQVRQRAARLAEGGREAGPRRRRRPGRRRAGRRSRRNRSTT